MALSALNLDPMLAAPSESHMYYKSHAFLMEFCSPWISIEVFCKGHVLITLSGLTRGNHGLDELQIGDLVPGDARLPG